MKRFSVAICACALAISAAVATVGTVSASAQSDANKATEVGVTPTQIRIAVVADVDNPFAPGLFQSAVDAVNGAAKYINANGGIAGRKIKVDFIDSHLNGNETRNAIITACQQDFALVGTEALFLSNMDDAINCKDINGAATGLPDLAAIATGIPETCAPVTYTPTGPQLLCDTKSQHPQTYQGNQGDSTYFKKNLNKNLDGAFVLPNDTQDANRGDAVQQAIAQQNGIKVDQSVTASGRDPQSVYTPVVQKMKTDNSNYGWSGLAFANVVQFHNEAQLQGITTRRASSGAARSRATTRSTSRPVGRRPERHLHPDGVPPVRRRRAEQGRGRLREVHRQDQGRGSRRVRLGRRHRAPAGAAVGGEGRRATTASPGRTCSPR